MPTTVRALSLTRGFAVLTACIAMGGCGVSNAPQPKELLAENVFFTSFQERPKYLDPVSSYSNDESIYTYAIYEPLFQYHYLKRPYVLEGRTATEVPTPKYLDKNGNPLPDDAPSEQIATSVYTVHIKPGIKFQPHPAFARDAQGNPLYLDLKPEQIADKFTIHDFALEGAATSTRELTADDYVYQIKRIASPYVSSQYVSMPSPMYSLMSQYIVGLRDLGERLRAERKAALAARPARDQYLPWRDLRELPFDGARAVDAHTLEVRVNGKYPQFKYWLAMPFFAPIPWEADKFYAQRGMAANGLQFNSWPVGTGAFMLWSQSPNRYVLKRNPNYRGEPYPCEGMPGDRERGLLDDCGKPLPFLDQIVFSLEKEKQPEEAKFLQGYYDAPRVERLDTAFPLLKEVMDRSGRYEMIRDHGIQLVNTLEPNNWYMGFNWLDPVVGKGNTPEEQEKHRKLRQAISIATDWEEHYTVFFDTYGPAQTAMGPVPPGLFGYREGEAGINPITHVWKNGRAERRPLEEAKKLLAEAGYPDGRDEKTGRPLVLYYDSNGVGPAYQARLDWQVKQMNKLNVQLEIRSADYNRFQDRMRKGHAQIYFWGWLADYPDAENFLFLLYGPQAKTKYDGENNSNFEDPEYDRLYNRMKDLPDGPERQATIDKMVDLVRHEAVWMFGLYPGSTGLYQSWVGNAKPTIIIRNHIQYVKVDAKQRVQKIAEWNRSQWWPIGVGIGLLLLLAWPAWRIWRHRENATARKSYADIARSA